MAKVIISLPDQFLKEVDKIAKRELRSRSELFREAIRVYLSVNKDVQIKYEPSLKNISRKAK